MRAQTVEAINSKDELGEGHKHLGHRSLLRLGGRRRCAMGRLTMVFFILLY
jgi:hypothetical protein